MKFSPKRRTPCGLVSTKKDGIGRGSEWMRTGHAQPPMFKGEKKLKVESMTERYARLDAEVKRKRDMHEKIGVVGPSAPKMYFPTSFIKGEAFWMDDC